MKKICVVTGSRAEYGLLHLVMTAIRNSSELELQVIATGMHLSPEFGLTYREIKKDGFHIDIKVEMLLSSDTPVGIVKSAMRKKQNVTITNLGEVLEHPIDMTTILIVGNSTTFVYDNYMVTKRGYKV